MRLTLTTLSVLLLIGCSDDGDPSHDAGTKLDKGVLTDGSAVADKGPVSDQGPVADQGPVVDKGLGADQGPAHDGINITCGAQLGTATTSGTVSGNAIGATHAGGVSVNLGGLGGYGIALLGQGGTCSGLAAVMSQPKLWLLLCDNKPGVHTIGENCLSGSGGISFQNQASIPQTGSDVKASGGTITIDAFDSTCGQQVKGSFSLQFGNDQISGTFDSVGCGSISM